MSKYYLEEGDDVVADFVHLTLVGDGSLINPFLEDSNLWYDGLEVQTDKDGMYVEYK